MAPRLASKLPFTSTRPKSRPSPKEVIPRSCRSALTWGLTRRDGCGRLTDDITTIAANVLADGADIPTFLDQGPGKAFGGLNRQADPLEMAGGSGSSACGVPDWLSNGEFGLKASFADEVLERWAMSTPVLTLADYLSLSCWKGS